MTQKPISPDLPDLVSCVLEPLGLAVQVDVEHVLISSEPYFAIDRMIIDMIVAGAVRLRPIAYFKLALPPFDGAVPLNGSGLHREVGAEAVRLLGAFGMADLHADDEVCVYGVGRADVAPADRSVFVEAGNVDPLKVLRGLEAGHRVMVLPYRSCHEPPEAWQDLGGVAFLFEPSALPPLTIAAVPVVPRLTRVHSPKTKYTYAREVARFREWCGERGVFDLPVPDHTIARWIGALVESGRRRAGIDVAVAAVRHAHREIDPSWQLGAKARAAQRAAHR